jgi:hypothetical protein
MIEYLYVVVLAVELSRRVLEESGALASAKLEVQKGPSLTFT